MSVLNKHTSIGDSVIVEILSRIRQHLVWVHKFSKNLGARKVINKFPMEDTSISCHIRKFSCMGDGTSMICVPLWFKMHIC